MKKATLFLFAFLTPAVALAQRSPDLSGIKLFIIWAGYIIGLLIPIAVGIAVFLFMWGLALFVFRSGDTSAKEEGRRKMVWGAIALFVIVSVWGIIGFFGNIVGIDQGGTAPVPGVAGIGGRGPTPPQNFLGKP